MNRGIPTTLGLLTLSALTLGCSDAHKLADAFEALCKSQCECPSERDNWHHLKNCKLACEGDAKTLEAVLGEREDQPCDNLGKIAHELKGCAKSTCESFYTCVEPLYNDLSECWPDGYYYYTQDADGDAPDDLARGIPRPLRRLALHSAAQAEE